MKLTFLIHPTDTKKLERILLSTILLLFCIAGQAQQQKVRITGNNITLKAAFKQIEQQTGMSIDFSSGELNDSRIIPSLPGEGAVKDILPQLLADPDLNIRFQDKHIIITKGYKLGQQTKTVKGKIVDQIGEPVIGANVLEKGTTNGNITDLDGNFMLTIQENATLQVTYIGYLPQEVSTQNKQEFHIILKEDTRALDEVVVVGYGTQKKVNLTGAVTSVKFDQELENRPITNASQALSGKVAGLWVSQNSGKPGEDGAQLRIRGWGTLNNSNPLVIIDGAEGGFDQINPNDIESVSVLKDAASAAIYGSKAANGVILVTTKMGSREEKTQVNFTSYLGVQTLGRKYDLINNSAESMTMSNKAYTNEGKSPIYPDYLVNAFKEGSDPYTYPNTDWFGVMFEPSLMYEGNLSIKGGTQRSSSFLSINYLNQDGMVPNTKSYRYSIRANTEYDINNWLKVGGRFNYMRRIADEPYDLGRAFETLREATPFIAAHTRDGRFGSSEAINDQGTCLYDNRNPLIDASNGQRRTTSDFLSANVFIQFDLTRDLIFKATWSSSGTWQMLDRYNEPLYGYTDSGKETITKNYNREGLEMIREQSTSMNNNLYSTLSYNKTLNSVHDISAIAGLQLEDYSVKNVRARRSDPPKSGLTQVDAGTSGIQGSGNLVGLRMFSYFGRINYAFQQKYLLEANLRADASSRFSESNRWGYFPGFSAGWRIGEEDFIRNLELFSNMKLRASWGQLGNQSIAGYWPYLTVINQDNGLSYSYNGAFSPGAAVTAMVDPNITWETTTTLDIGADIGLLDNKLNLELDYFHKKTTDIIVQLPIPLTLGGISAPYENVGAMVNKGIDFTLNYGNKTADPDQFGYDVSLNLTYLYNEVTKFRGGKSPDQLYLIREGYSYQTLYGYKVTGIYQTDEEATEHMHANGFKPKAGYLKFDDVNQDGKLGYEDKQELGNTIPKVTYGLSTNFKYKNFDLSLLFQGIAGAHLYTQNTYTILDYERQTITSKWKNAWTPENPNTNIPSLKFNSTWENSENSFWVHRSDFLKLKNVQLGYLVPRSLISKWKIENAYVYANAQNVFTVMMYKGYEGFDPERTSNGSGDSLYPVARVFSIGINLTF